MTKKRTITRCDRVAILPINGKEYITQAPMTIEWIENKTGEVFRMVIEKGYKTDGASIPRILWPLMHPLGKAFWAALPHDKLYERNCMDCIEKATMTDAGLVWVYVNPFNFPLENPRKFADSLFKDVQEYTQAGKVPRWTTYLSVRLFGGGAY
jgi:hypothetical protein